MSRLRLVFSTVLVIAVLATGAFAQDYIFTNFIAYKDYPAPPSPCALLGPAQPVVYDTSFWLFYTCDNGQVIARRFFHPVDNLNRGTSPAPIPPVAPLSACPGNFVAGRLGGCVPPDHPLSVR